MIAQAVALPGASPRALLEHSLALFNEPPLGVAQWDSRAFSGPYKR